MRYEYFEDRIDAEFETLLYSDKLDDLKALQAFVCDNEKVREVLFDEFVKQEEARFEDDLLEW